MTSNTYSSSGFPQADDQQKAKTAHAETNSAKLAKEEQFVTSLIRLFGTVLVLAILIGLGVAFNLNPIASNGNAREAMGMAEVISSFFASFAFEAALLGVGGAITIAFIPSVPLAKRLLISVVMLIMLASVFLLTSGIGFHTMKDILSTLWTGATDSFGALDPSTQNTAEDKTPFWLRLASSVMFMGVGFGAMLAEGVLIFKLYKRAQIRQALAQYKVILDHNAAYASDRKAYLSTIEELKTLLDPDYQHARAFSAVFKKIQSYRVSAEAMRPNPASLANMDKATYDRRIQDAGKVEIYLKSADTVAAKTTEIEALINKFFPRSTATPTPTPTV